MKKFRINYSEDEDKKNGADAKEEDKPDESIEPPEFDKLKKGNDSENLDNLNEDKK